MKKKKIIQEALLNFDKKRKILWHWSHNLLSQQLSILEATLQMGVPKNIGLPTLPSQKAYDISLRGTNLQYFSFPAVLC